MMKALILLSTIWIGLTSFDLPIVNTLPNNDGKCIKDQGISTFDLFPPDSNVFVITPEFKLTGPSSYQINTVVIDPGHGGHDPGCIGHSSREKHIVLSIGKYLAAGLKAQYPNLNVIMTRSTDVFVPLHERASIATENKADLFISLHCNAFSRTAAQGTETYVLGLHATEENLEVAKRENEAILLEDNYQENYGYDPNSPEAHIMFSMFQNAFLEQSIAFAEKVQGQAKNQAGMKDRGVKQAGFLVLRYATMPSVLVETGYLTNSTDEAFLMTDAGQMQMANAIQDAFGEYKREMERTVNAEAPATVAFVEVKKTTPVTYQPRPEPTPSKAEPSITRQETFATPSIDNRIKEETEKAKKLGLEIAPPTNAIATNSNTNTSPKKNSKIAPNTPVQEKFETTPVVDPPKKIEPAVATTNKTVSQNIATTNATQSKVQYCVQLAASPTMLNASVGKWTRITETVEVIQEANLYKYQVRNFATHQEAARAMSGLRAKGFSDAFVVAYKDGQRVDPKTLK
ncbi:MAG: N-acetylmuramoyl-L-alanine amidase [Saprospiraceae bacterium]